MTIDNYWMWLTSLDLFDSRNIKTLLQYYCSAEEVWHASLNELKCIEQLPEKYIYKIISTRNEYTIEKQLELLHNNNVKYISINNTLYPKNLKNICDYPYGIYVKGALPRFDTKTIAVVGSRKCTDYGANVTNMLTRELAKMGVVIVSGMAYGIDTCAHKGALDAKKEGCTIAVLGCGVDVCYPKTNSQLMTKITQNGAVVSEYPLGTQPHPYFFPLRNRIISGLSDAVILVEAARKSGSLITADQAIEQGRTVFAVPGNITSKFSEGTNDLIRQGAAIVTCLDDVLNELGLEKTHEKNQKKEMNIEDFLAPNEKLVYDCISLEPKNMDIIFNQLCYPIKSLQCILSLLELKGYIKQLPGQRYMRTL